MRLPSWLFASLLCASCGDAPQSRVHGRIDLVVLHTADLHSQLFPRPIWVGARDAERGLGAYATKVAVGGAARLAAIFGRERAHAKRLLAFDSGDALSGAAVFNAFQGRAELSVLSELGLSAQVLGNHEFDLGPERLASGYRAFAGFPVVSANLSAFARSSSLLDFVEPWTVTSSEGLRVGVVGVIHPSSPAVLREPANPFGAVLADSVEAVQVAVDSLRPAVDLVVVLTHIGLAADEALIRATSGIDVVLGGHQHFVLDEPRVVHDCGARREAGRSFIRTGQGLRRCEPRPVVLVHSGAFAKFVGRLELDLSDRPRDLPASYDPLDGFEVLGSRFELLPVTAAAGEDAAVASLLEPYRDELGAKLDSGFVGAYAPAPLQRYGITQGDSPLGNFAAEAMLSFADADLSLLNTTGLRSDLAEGPITPEQWFEILPFEDSVVVVSLFGRELEALFDALGEKARERGTSPVQIAGARLEFLGTGCARGAPDCASVVVRAEQPGCAGGAACFRPLEPDRLYALATTGYLAAGPSGYEALRAGLVTDSGESLREVAEDFARNAARCSHVERDLAACRAGITAFYRSRCGEPEPGRTLLGCALNRDLGDVAADLCAALPCLHGQRDGRIGLRLD